jgi:tape measure domain-containing protein
MSGIVIDVGADTTRAEEKLHGLAHMAQQQRTKVGVDADTTSAEAQLKRFNDKAKRQSSAQATGSGPTAAPTQPPTNTVAAALREERKLTKEKDAQTRLSYKKVIDSMKQMNDQIGATSRAIKSVSSSIQGLLAVTVAAVSVKSVVDITSRITELENSVAIVTGREGQLQTTLSSLRDISIETARPIDSVVKSFRGLGQSTEAMLPTYASLLKATTTLQKAGVVSGGSADSFNSAIFQLNQGLASGVVRGEEFNSIAEQAPALLPMFAAELNVARSELRALVNDGKLTSATVFSALINQAGMLEESFAKINLPISAYASQVGEWTSLVMSGFVEGTGATRLLGDSLKSIIAYLKELSDSSFWNGRGLVRRLLEIREVSADIFAPLWRQFYVAGLKIKGASQLLGFETLGKKISAHVKYGWGNIFEFQFYQARRYGELLRKISEGDYTGAFTMFKSRKSEKNLQAELQEQRDAKLAGRLAGISFEAGLNGIMNIRSASRVQMWTGWGHNVLGQKGDIPFLAPVKQAFDSTFRTILADLDEFMVTFNTTEFSGVFDGLVWAGNKLRGIIPPEVKRDFDAMFKSFYDTRWFRYTATWAGNLAEGMDHLLESMIGMGGVFSKVAHIALTAQHLLHSVFFGFEAGDLASSIMDIARAGSAINYITQELADNIRARNAAGVLMADFSDYILYAVAIAVKALSMLPTTTEMYDGLVRGFEKALTFINDLLSGRLTFRDVGFVLASELKAIITTVKNFVGELLGIDFSFNMDFTFRSVLASAIFTLKAALGAVYLFCKGVIDFFFGVYDAVIAHSWWTDTMEAIAQTSNDLLLGPLRSVKQFASSVVEAFEGMFYDAVPKKTWLQQNIEDADALAAKLIRIGSMGAEFVVANANVIAGDESPAAKARQKAAGLDLDQYKQAGIAAAQAQTAQLSTFMNSTAIGRWAAAFATAFLDALGSKMLPTEGLVGYVRELYNVAMRELWGMVAKVWNASPAARQQIIQAGHDVGSLFGRGVHHFLENLPHMFSTASAAIIGFVRGFLENAGIFQGTFRSIFNVGDNTGTSGAMGLVGAYLFGPNILRLIGAMGFFPTHLFKLARALEGYKKLLAQWRDVSKMPSSFIGQMLHGAQFWHTAGAAILLGSFTGALDSTFNNSDYAHQVADALGATLFFAGSKAGTALWTAIVGTNPSFNPRSWYIIDEFMKDFEAAMVAKVHPLRFALADVIFKTLTEGFDRGFTGAAAWLRGEDVVEAMVGRGSASLAHWSLFQLRVAAHLDTFVAVLASISWRARLASSAIGLLMIAFSGGLVGLLGYIPIAFTLATSFDVIKTAVLSLKAAIGAGPIGALWTTFKTSPIGGHVAPALIAITGTVWSLIKALGILAIAWATSMSVGPIVPFASSQLDSAREGLSGYANERAAAARASFSAGARRKPSFEIPTEFSKPARYTLQLLGAVGKDEAAERLILAIKELTAFTKFNPELSTSIKVLYLAIETLGLKMPLLFEVLVRDVINSHGQYSGSVPSELVALPTKVVIRDVLRELLYANVVKPFHDAGWPQLLSKFRDIAVKEVFKFTRAMVLVEGARMLLGKSAEAAERPTSLSLNGTVLHAGRAAAEYVPANKFVMEPQRKTLKQMVDDTNPYVFDAEIAAGGVALGHILRSFAKLSPKAAFAGIASTLVGMGGMVALSMGMAEEPPLPVDPSDTFTPPELETGGLFASWRDSIRNNLGGMIGTDSRPLLSALKLRSSEFIGNFLARSFDSLDKHTEMLTAPMVGVLGGLAATIISGIVAPDATLAAVKDMASGMWGGVLGTFKALFRGWGVVIAAGAMGAYTTVSHMLAGQMLAPDQMVMAAYASWNALPPGQWLYGEREEPSMGVDELKDKARSFPSVLLSIATFGVSISMLMAQFHSLRKQLEDLGGSLSVVKATRAYENAAAIYDAMQSLRDTVTPNHPLRYGASFTKESLSELRAIRAMQDPHTGTLFRQLLAQLVKTNHLLAAGKMIDIAKGTAAYGGDMNVTLLTVRVAEAAARAVLDATHGKLQAAKAAATSVAEERATITIAANIARWSALVLGLIGTYTLLTEEITSVAAAIGLASTLLVFTARAAGIWHGSLGANAAVVGGGWSLTTAAITGAITGVVKWFGNNLFTITAQLILSAGYAMYSLVQKNLERGNNAWDITVDGYLAEVWEGFNGWAIQILFATGLLRASASALAGTSLISPLLALPARLMLALAPLSLIIAAGAAVKVLAHSLMTLGGVRQEDASSMSNALAGVTAVGLLAIYPTISKAVGLLTNFVGMLVTRTAVMPAIGTAAALGITAAGAGAMALTVGALTLAGGAALYLLGDSELNFADRVSDGWGNVWHFLTGAKKEANLDEKYAGTGLTASQEVFASNYGITTAWDLDALGYSKMEGVQKETIDARLKEVTETLEKARSAEATTGIAPSEADLRPIREVASRFQEGLVKLVNGTKLDIAKDAPNFALRRESYADGPFAGFATNWTNSGGGVGGLLSALSDVVVGYGAGDWASDALNLPADSILRKNVWGAGVDSGYIDPIVYEDARAARERMGAGVMKLTPAELSARKVFENDLVDFRYNPAVDGFDARLNDIYNALAKMDADRVKLYHNKPKMEQVQFDAERATLENSYITALQDAHAVKTVRDNLAADMRDRGLMTAKWNDDIGSKINKSPMLDAKIDIDKTAFNATFRKALDAAVNFAGIVKVRIKFDKTEEARNQAILDSRIVDARLERAAKQNAIVAKTSNEKLKEALPILSNDLKDFTAGLSSADASNILAKVNEVENVKGLFAEGNVAKPLLADAVKGLDANQSRNIQEKLTKVEARVAKFEGDLTASDKWKQPGNMIRVAYEKAQKQLEELELSKTAGTIEPEVYARRKKKLVANSRQILTDFADYNPGYDELERLKVEKATSGGYDEAVAAHEKLLAEWATNEALLAKGPAAIMEKATKAMEELYAAALESPRAMQLLTASLLEGVELNGITNAEIAAARPELVRLIAARDAAVVSKDPKAISVANANYAAALARVTGPSVVGLDSKLANAGLPYSVNLTGLEGSGIGSLMATFDKLESANFAKTRGGNTPAELEAAIQEGAAAMREVAGFSLARFKSDYSIYKTGLEGAGASGNSRLYTGSVIDGLAEAGIHKKMLESQPATQETASLLDDLERAIEILKTQTRITGQAIQAELESAGISLMSTISGATVAAGGALASYAQRAAAITEMLKEASIEESANLLIQLGIVKEQKSMLAASVAANNLTVGSKLSALTETLGAAISDLAFAGFDEGGTAAIAKLATYFKAQMEVAKQQDDLSRFAQLAQSAESLKAYGSTLSTLSDLREDALKAKVEGVTNSIDRVKKSFDSLQLNANTYARMTPEQRNAMTESSLKVALIDALNSQDNLPDDLYNKAIAALKSGESAEKVRAELSEQFLKRLGVEFGAKLTPLEEASKKFAEGVKNAGETNTSFDTAVNKFGEFVDKFITSPIIAPAPPSAPLVPPAPVSLAPTVPTLPSLSLEKNESPNIMATNRPMIKMQSAAAVESMYDDLIQQASVKYGVEAAFIKAIIANESGFRKGVVSEAGAVGLMQVLPTTAKLPHNALLDPATNIDAGTKYLASLRTENNSDKSLMAAGYNAGGGTSRKDSTHEAHALAAYPETRAYVAKVLSSYSKYAGKPLEKIKVPVVDVAPPAVAPSGEKKNLADAQGVRAAATQKYALTSQFTGFIDDYLTRIGSASVPIANMQLLKDMGAPSDNLTLDDVSGLAAAYLDLAKITERLETATDITGKDWDAKRLSQLRVDDLLAKVRVPTENDNQRFAYVNSSLRSRGSDFLKAQGVDEQAIMAATDAQRKLLEAKQYEISIKRHEIVEAQRAGESTAALYKDLDRLTMSMEGLSVGVMAVTNAGKAFKSSMQGFAEGTFKDLLSGNTEGFGAKLLDTFTGHVTDTVSKGLAGALGFGRGGALDQALTTVGSALFEGPGSLLGSIPGIGGLLSEIGGGSFAGITPEDKFDKAVDKFAQAVNWSAASATLKGDAAAGGGLLDSMSSAAPWLAGGAGVLGAGYLLKNGISQDMMKGAGISKEGIGALNENFGASDWFGTDWGGASDALSGNKSQTASAIQDLITNQGVALNTPALSKLGYSADDISSGAISMGKYGAAIQKPGAPAGFWEDIGDTISGWFKNSEGKNIFVDLWDSLMGLFGFGAAPTGMATGGRVSGPGTSTSDSIPTMLSDGEFVINAKSTRKHAGLLQAINNDSLVHRASGGLVSNVMSIASPVMGLVSSMSGQSANAGLMAAATALSASAAALSAAAAALGAGGGIGGIASGIAGGVKGAGAVAAPSEFTTWGKTMIGDGGGGGADALGDLSGGVTDISKLANGLPPLPSDTFSGVWDTFSEEFSDGFANMDFGNMFGALSKGISGAFSALKDVDWGGMLGSIGGIFGFAATGGHITGPGTGTSDSIPTMLSNGEFVINAAATSKNLGLLHAINAGSLPKFATGGLVGAAAPMMITPSASKIPQMTKEAGVSGNGQTVVNLQITGDISRQTKSEIFKMMPSIADGVNSTNRERGYRR